MIKKIKNPAIKKSEFIIIPEIKDDELLTSWFVRTAYAHFTHPHTFINLHLNKSSQVLNCNSFDVCISDKEIKILEEKSRRKISLFETTLRSYSGYLQENIINNGLNKLLCSQRFCPVCLREDKIVYFRKKWKILFNTICEKHKCFLYELCPQCNSTIDISKMFQNKLSFKYCYKCGFDLSKARKLSINKHLINGYLTVRKLNSILKKGYICFDKDFIYSFYFFDSLLQLSKKILKHKKVLYLNKQYIYKYIKFRDYKSTKPILHQVSIKEQYALFSLSYYLFRKFPSNIKKYIKENNLSAWDITKDMDYISYWFENLINDIVPREPYPARFLTKEEIENGKKYLKRNGLILNKANLTRLFGCNFFSSYNNLEVGEKSLK